MILNMFFVCEVIISKFADGLVVWGRGGEEVKIEVTEGFKGEK